MEKRWNIATAQADAVQSLQQALKVSPVICDILVKRGILTFNEAKEYFRPSLSNLHSPWLMKDMDVAVKRVLSAFEQNEKILVFGDYDVDGTTAVAGMFQFLSAIHPNIDFYIPHRYKEGYGISKMGIDYAHENNCSLIIALDCGIKSIDLIDYAASLQIDFIVCDHHQPGDELPNAVAILNPKQKNCGYPYKELCGCGVGMKLMMGISESLNLPDASFLKYLDLFAISIAADIVPITGENRIITYHGLQQINQNPSAGIKALMTLAGCKPPLDVSSLVFMIAPRINAAGRMDEGRNAVHLFIEQNEEKAMAFAEKLHLDNSNRKEADLNITAEALDMIRSNAEMATKKTTVVYKDSWHKGVVGIVASRLMNNYYRPTIVLTKSGDIVAGSARSVNGFNVYDAIDACKEHLIGYGGHFAAAGMTLLPEKVEAFSLKFEEVVKNSINDELLIPEIAIDSCISFNDINFSFYNIITQMEPFGPLNMRPVFVTRNVMVNPSITKIVKDAHIKFGVVENNCTFIGIGFNLAGKFDLLQQQKCIDIVYTIDVNEWNNEKTLQLKVIDFKLSEN